MRSRTIRDAVLGAAFVTIAGLVLLGVMLGDGSLESLQDVAAVLRNPATRAEIIILAVPLSIVGTTVGIAVSWLQHRRARA
jgi:hypothetical protein